MPLVKRILFGTHAVTDAQKKALSVFLLAAGAIIYWELLMHGILMENFSWRIGYVILFSLFFGLVVTMLTGMLGRRGNIAVLWVLMSVLYLWYASQFVYYRIFGGFISASLVRMGGQALTNFFKETVACIWQNLWLLALLALPLPVTGVLLYTKRIDLTRRPWEWVGRQVILGVVVHLLCLGCLQIGGTGAYSVYDAYHNVNTGTDLSVNNLGFLTTIRLELKFMLMGVDQQGPSMDDVVIMDPSDLENILGGGNNSTTESTGPEDTTGDPNPSAPSEPIIQYYNQTMEINFDALIAQALANGDSALATLHQYFAAQAPTKTNDFTGMFAGKNLIYMVCESFSPVVISKEMTPTLYKLYNEGIKFTNFYGTYRNVTTNGEYTACLGIFPDLSRSKSDGSFAASAKNYLPFALGNMFQSQLGVSSNAFHNYKATYYNRRYSHPNMGYSLKAMGTGMKFTYGWPSSDLEMMQQSVADYVNKDQFHAYYMTFSGHYKYDFETNPICIQNKDMVMHLDYSEPVKAYISCHLELEKAMAYLMEELEKAGKLEDTVIVMTSDHYPYGLKEKQYSELAGEKKDGDFGIYENAFICWSYGMEDPIVVDTPCCTVDILPTLLNLFGFKYDSRLLIGRDVLDPNAQHIAILHNGSFITDKVMFNSKTGKTIYLVDEATVPDAYVDTVIKLVQSKFTVSTAILDRDYYRIVFTPER